MQTKSRTSGFLTLSLTNKLNKKMKDGLGFGIHPVCDDWDNIEGYEAIITDEQADGHTTFIDFEGSSPRQVLDKAIIYLENRIKELADFRDTLKTTIKEE